MTAPGGGGADEIREQLAAALDDTATGIFMGKGWGDAMADALLPSVQALIAKGAAAAREQAYWTVLDAGDVWLARDKRSRPPVVAEYLAGLAEDVRDGLQHRVPWPWRVPAEDGTP